MKDFPLGLPACRARTKGEVLDALTIARTAQAILDSELERQQMRRQLAGVSTHLRGPDSFGLAADGIVALARRRALPARAMQAPSTLGAGGTPSRRA